MIAHDRISMTVVPFSFVPSGKWLGRWSLKLIHSSTCLMLVANGRGPERTGALHSQGCYRPGEGKQVTWGAAPDRMVLDKPRLPLTRQQTRQQPAGVAWCHQLSMTTTELLCCPEQTACCLWASSITSATFLGLHGFSQDPF